MKPVRTVTPVLRYRDPSAAAEWLCKALGFERAHLAKDPRGRTYYISLKLGDCVVLLCPLANSVLRDLMVQPADVGGANTQICYLTVHDLAAHLARAEAAGAEITLNLQDDGAAGRFYMCRDPEGHLWSIGTRAHGGGFRDLSSSGRSRLARLASLAAVLLVLGGLVLFNTDYRMLAQSAGLTISSPSPGEERLAQVVADELARRLQLEAVAKESAEKLEREQAVSTELRQGLQRAQSDLQQMRLAKEKAEGAIAATKAAGVVAEQSAKHATEAFVQERAAANAAQKANDAHLAKIAQLKAEVLAERARAAQALGQEGAAAKAAGEARDARLAKIAELEAAVRAERELRVAAEIEIASLRERQARSQPVTAPDAGKEEKLALPVANEEPIPKGPSEKAAPPPPGETKAEPIASSECALAVQDKIAFGRKGSKTWDTVDIARLCKGAETSGEPGKCFGQLMTGKISWGGGRVWMASNALALCAGTHDANQTLDCFTKSIAEDQPWRTAIARCRSK